MSDHLVSSISDLERCKRIVSPSIVVCTDYDRQEFVGSFSLATLASDVPAVRAYCYDSLADADRAARSLGLSDYMLGTLEDLTK